MQAFVLIGYNSIPLPGGVGAFEYLYLHIYGLLFEDAFILSAMMVTRTISHYLCILVTIRISIHIHILKRKKEKINYINIQEKSENEERE